MLRRLARRGSLGSALGLRTPLRPALRLRGLCTPAETVSFVFVEDGEEIPATASVGRSLLEAAHDNDVDLEGAAPTAHACVTLSGPRVSSLTAVRAGACDHSLACSTCHVILEQEVFDALDPVDDEEMDMLDLAFGLEDTSRLGCQIKVTKLLEGRRVVLPDGATNFQK